MSRRPQTSPFSRQAHSYRSVILWDAPTWSTGPSGDSQNQAVCMMPAPEEAARVRDPVSGLRASRPQRGYRDGPEPTLLVPGSQRRAPELWEQASFGGGDTGWGAEPWMWESKQEVSLHGDAEQGESRWGLAWGCTGAIRAGGGPRALGL